MSSLVPLTVAVPLLGAAVLAAFCKVLPRAAIDAIGVLCAIAVVTLCALVTADTGHMIVYWFGGFHPHGSVAVGISFSVDRLGGGMAVLSAVLVTAAMVYSVHYFDEIGSLYSALMLVFLGAMVGFCLT
ncbi:MAG TPA: hypothetical protein VFW29_01845, partial [Solirubrobacteraceae bacterium]|nr:hypothetical protein [Solirubrobacteraceae bacterium]